MKGILGYTLVSLMLGGALAAALAIAALPIYQQEIAETKALAATKYVEALNKSTQRYYDAHCQDALFKIPTIVTLIDQKFLTAGASIKEALYGNPIIEIIDVGQKSVLFKYKVTYPNAGLAQISVGTSNSVSILGNIAIWEYTSRSTGSDSLIESYEYLSAFGGNTCE